MRRALALSAVLLLLGAGGAALWWHNPPSPLTARHAPGDCRVLAITDVRTGAAVVGIEDLAAGSGGALFLSAYDRLAAEAALAEGSRPPDGGVYRLAAAALDGAGPVPATPLIEPAARPGGLHPHGIHRAGDALLVINRRLGASGGARPAILRVPLGGGAPETVAGPADWLCPANDLLRRDGRLLVTLDRGDCPGLSARDALWPDRGRVVAIAGAGGARETLAGGLAHANGIAIWHGTAGAPPVVAETRAGRLSVLGGPAVPTPGGPDNLSPAPGGGVVAALHPSLLRLALYRHGWTERAPARVARIGPAGAVEILHDDPAGRLLPGVTAAVLAGGRLIAGSVRAPGLLVCGGRG